MESRATAWNSLREISVLLKCSLARGDDLILGTNGAWRQLAASVSFFTRVRDCDTSYPARERYFANMDCRHFSAWWVVTEVALFIHPQTTGKPPGCSQKSDDAWPNSLGWFEEVEFIGIEHPYNPVINGDAPGGHQNIIVAPR